MYRDGLERHGVDQAEAYAAGFWETVAFLADFPRAARLRQEVDPPVRAHPYRSHLIVSEIEEDGIAILRIPHAREDWAAD
ncbi:MAG: type II toxin-antitoxin system RelE/ParE family toxin [Sphingomonas adhaesiva]|uniref:type II toxin-antitoxin system RelE/ParE family toxin n=1 Tax=Sphingomonas adhaesiva TaxID=28212 RepID=UPI002FF8B66C